MAHPNSQAERGLDFVEAVANCVHDLKNSAGLVIQAADSIDLSIPNLDFGPQLSALQSEARRINNDLMHLLGLYKLEHATQLIRPAIVDCEELLFELRAYNDPLFRSRGLVLITDAGESVEGYFDRDLVLGILNSAVNNAQRYARASVRISCDIEDGYTVIRVDDDGDGYSEQALQRSEFQPLATDYENGSTGLGLFFASRIAKLHQHRDRSGRITLSNEGINGGGRFCLWLP